MARNLWRSSERDHKRGGRPGSAGSILSVVIVVLQFFLALTTVLAFFILVLGAFGSTSTVYLDGRTGTVVPLRPLPGEFDGQLADVAETTRFGSRDGEVALTETRVEIRPEGSSAGLLRAAGFATVMVWLGLAWVGVLTLKGLVESANHDPFVPANVGRLRRLGLICLAVATVPIANQLLWRSLIDRLDFGGPPVVVDLPLGDWWAWGVAGLLLLVLAQVFAQGIALRELEHATI